MCLVHSLALVVLGIVVTSGLVVESEGPSTRLDALEYMLVEEKQLRAQQKTELEARINKLEACGCKSVSQDNHPAFLASFRSSSGVDCSALQHVVFDDVRLNSGNVYNPNHGVFTAPISGLYAFQINLAAPPQTNFHVAIVQNVTSNEIAYLFHDSTDQWKKLSSSTLTHLNAGEDVWMICLGGSHLEGHTGHTFHGAGDYNSYFSGFLVGAD